MFYTTTDSIEGYLIKEYVRFVSASAVYLPGGWVGEGVNDSTQTNMMNTAYNSALEQMVKQTDGRANALIGIRSSISSAMNGYVLLNVYATAVRVEQIVDPQPRTVSDLKREQEALAARQQEEARQQRIKQRQEMIARGELPPIDLKTVLTELQQMESAQDMMKRIDEISEISPAIFPDELLQKLRKNLEISRVQGKRFGARCFVQDFAAYVREQS